MTEAWPLLREDIWVEQTRLRNIKWLELMVNKKYLIVVLTNVDTKYRNFVLANVFVCVSVCVCVWFQLPVLNTCLLYTSGIFWRTPLLSTE